MKVYLNKARQVYHAGGILALIRGGLTFVLWSLVNYETFYLVENFIQDSSKYGEPAFLPDVDAFSFKVVATIKEADDLEADGFKFYSRIVNARHRLKEGATAFCAFSGHELVNSGWGATTEAASKAMGWPPVKANFDNEVIAGADVTASNYRGKGLMGYNELKKVQYYANRGKTRIIGAIRKGNAVSVSVTVKSGYKIYGEGSYLRILGWRRWKEKRI